MQPVKYPAELIRRDIIYPVKRAVGRVHRAVKIELGCVLTEVQRHYLGVKCFAGGLHEHIGRGVYRDHLVAAARHERRERSRAAAKVEKRFELASVGVKQGLVKIGKVTVGDIARKRIVPH